MHRPKKPAPGFVPGPAARMPCIVGRAFTPAGRRRGGVAVLCKNRTVGSCNAARPGGYAEPGRVLAKPGAAPLSRLTPTAPLTGEPFRRQDLYKASPARGGGCAGKRRRERGFFGMNDPFIRLEQVHYHYPDAPAEALRGVRLPAAGVPARQGQGPFLFLRKKKRALTPKKNEAGLRWVGGGPRRLASLRTVVRTSPGRYGHAVVEQGWALGSILRPPGCATLAAECSKSPAPPQGKHPTTLAVREAPAGGGGLERQPVPVPQGQAVTAGRGPQCHMKAARRRGRPPTHRRPAPSFSLG